jgi:antibiotic biosynthesis monooxygenase (ABM) superfamily enzyme
MSRPKWKVALACVCCVWHTAFYDMLGLCIISHLAVIRLGLLEGLFALAVFTSVILPWTPHLGLYHVLKAGD